MSIKSQKNSPVQCDPLTHLRSQFDAAIRNGGSFNEVKKIYTRLKNLKKYINSINVE